MTADREHLRVNWIFTVNGEDEIANTGLNFSSPTDIGFPAVTALGEIVTATQGLALQTRMTTLLGSINIKWANYSTIAAVRFSAVGTDGLEMAAPKLHTAVSPTTGGDSDVYPQCSIVLSLRSMTFGPGANFGRMFLPHTGFALVGGSPRADTPDVNAFATACETFVEGVTTDLNTVLTDTVAPMIMSNITGRQSRRVASIAIGDVTDTQRRRRNQLAETYTFRTITP